MRLVEEMQVVGNVVPVDVAAAAMGGDWVSLKNYRHVSIVLSKAAGGAAENATVTIQQASDVAGTGVKALNFTTFYRKEGADLTTVGTFTKVTQASGNTFTADGDSQGLYVLDFEADDLDADGGFDCVRLSIADVGVTAQLACAVYLLTKPRFIQESIPSAIVD